MKWFRTLIACTILRIGLLALPMLLLVTGCAKDAPLKTDYGKRRGSAEKSVNGTSVLAEMFREAGARPATIVYLSSGVNKYDVIIWAPDDFAMPTKKVREFVEKWLTGASGRTFVFVGRDYDAACDYWQNVVANAPSEQQLELMRQAAHARSAHSRARIEMPGEECCEWFVMRRDFPGARVTTLSGPWSDGLDASQTRIWSQGRLDIPTEKELVKFWKNDRPSSYLEPDYTPLLTSGNNSGNKTLLFEISKREWDGNRILVVANGSFLLNLPLVNHQHRMLAARLINECTAYQSDARVAFLESEAGGPFVSSRTDKTNEESVRKRVLLAAHWILLGAAYCLAVFPIFGRAKKIETKLVADFGQHVEAMASLLERTGNVTYARRQLHLFQRGQRPEQSRTSSTIGPLNSDLDQSNSDRSSK